MPWCTMVEAGSGVTEQADNQWIGCLNVDLSMVAAIGTTPDEILQLFQRAPCDDSVVSVICPKSRIPTHIQSIEFVEAHGARNVFRELGCELRVDALLNAWSTNVSNEMLTFAGDRLCWKSGSRNIVHTGTTSEHSFFELPQPILRPGILRPNPWRGIIEHGFWCVNEAQRSVSLTGFFGNTKNHV